MSTVAPQPSAPARPAVAPQPHDLVAARGALEQQLPRSSSPVLFARLRAVAVVVTGVLVVVAGVLGFTAQHDLGLARNDAAQYDRIATIQTDVAAAGTQAAQAAQQPSPDTTGFDAQLRAATGLVVQAAAADPTHSGTLATLNSALTTYAGQVHAAFAAESTSARQSGLASAQSTLAQQVTPALTGLGDDSLAAYRSHGATRSAAGVLVLGVVALACWAALGVVLALRTHRVLNVGVALALLATAGGMLFAAAGLRAASGIAVADGAALQAQLGTITASAAHAVTWLRIDCCAAAVLGIGAAVVGSIGVSRRLREYR